MKKFCYSLFVLLLFTLFYFSEGKPCPERTKPHKSRCDVFYKCTELSADKHVWVPTRCEEGLVYEHSLAVCVLPADEWECLMGDQTNININESNKRSQRKPSTNSDADIYIISNAEDEDTSSNSKYDDSKVEIIIGPDISDEDKDEAVEEDLYDGSGNGAESVELDGFMPAQNREDEVVAEEVPVLKKLEGEMGTQMKLEKDGQNIEQREELEEILQTIKTKSEIGQPSTNIDPNLTAHLQRLSQLIDGLKHAYQTPEASPQDEPNLRPDQLNAFLAHFNIKNKFDSLDPNDNFVDISTTTVSKPNGTLNNKHEFNAKLNPETKVVLSHTLPHRYGSGNYDNANSGGGYSNSQIVVNRPEGSVHFSLPEHHYMEHSDYISDNTPKISEETLKTVLELSKQMIAQQNVPKIIPSPTYFASPIMQPILLTPHVDSPFSTNYGSQGSNSISVSGQYNNHNRISQKPGKRPQYMGINSQYNGDDNNSYDSDSSNGYGNSKPATTIIHNNVIPVHLSGTNSGEKEVLDSYGQSLGLYPPLYQERPDSSLNYHPNSNSNTAYSSGFQNNEYSESTTKRPSYVSLSASASPYATTPRPFEYQPSTSALNQYFTPSQHLSNHNVNNVFSSVDNYGSIPRPMKGKKPSVQNYMPSGEIEQSKNGYESQNQLFPQINGNNVHVMPNSQSYGNFENDNEDPGNNYDDEANDDESQSITYTYGNQKKPTQQSQFANYGDSGTQNSINSVFSTNNPYMARPQSNSHSSILSSNSYYSSGKNKYTPISSPISSGYGEGNQLVNMGGNFISYDVFQNSILPFVGNNPAALSSSLNNVEVITCAAGVRQPNVTDCTRYYVCSKKDGKVLSYSCPPYTAFNSESRICDAKTYALCSGDSVVPNYSVSENKRIQMEALKAIQEAKRRQQQQQILKAQNMANFLQQYGSSSAPTINNPFTSLTSAGQENSELNMLSSYMQQAASMAQSAGTTPKPLQTTPTVKKRKYYCKEGDKIADQTSIYNYFVCYKNAKGQMKGHKMTCSKGLLFCPKSSMCTLSSKCS